MKPKLGQHLFYTAPESSGIKPGPYPCIVTSADGRNIVAFGAGRACAQVFDVDPEHLSADPEPYKAPRKSVKPPGVSQPLPGVTELPKAKAAKKAK